VEKPAPAEPSRWEKFRESPWAVQVVGGAIGAVLGVGILAALAYIAAQIFG
jgi:hypothetical protein